MVTWRKHYVVGDENKRDAFDVPEGTPPKKKSKAWKYWLWFAVFCFLGGLGIGVQEDQEWEAFTDTIIQKAEQGAPSQHIWKRAIQGYRLVYTDHFLCRMDCRNIRRAEVIYAILHGAAQSEYVNDRDDYSERRGDIKYVIIGPTTSGRLIKSVIAVNTRERILTFITTMDPSVDRSADPCISEDCRRD